MHRMSMLVRDPMMALLLSIAVATGHLAPAAAASSAQPEAIATPRTPADARPSLAAIASAADEIVRAAGDHRLVLIGEMHGTREVPQLAAALVARYSKTQPVVLGLELGRNGHAAIATYLRSGGSPADRQVLRDQQFLYAPPGRSDGRRNESVIDLIEALRQLREAGRDVAILPFDVSASTDGAEARDRRMAHYLRKSIEALPHGRLIVVTGNVHAMKARPDVPDAAKFQTPMGSYLLDLDPYAINVDARIGYFWACMPACGEQPVSPFATESGPSSGPFRNSFDYELVLPTFSTPDLIEQTPTN